MKTSLNVDEKGKLRCSIEYTLQKIGGKWKTVILWHLGMEGTFRYNEFRRLLPGITHKMLTQQLKELEHDGFIIRTQFDEIPPRVEYSISKIGLTLLPLLQEIHRWGSLHQHESR
ncbi:HxlR family transcriptional regulator [Bacillus coahuilensis p1.1.43]|uniref:HxlR family transcriptional regulator n=1 Tax=Bacillus coahuilensis p1.1.43 TaxID=1150625 RepID=A0A147KAP0_9BACI|nr:helix-turn-helix domain-containing protein [Bacillus coahuilensis]KUP07848.1 HxlR family transcriptional regulator [Bacillus coahuilensis p1.1.43]